jgi:hypothetical protein
MTGKPIYQQPIAEDLSGMSAFGGKVRPFASCEAGHTVSQEGCRTGYTPKTSNPLTACSPNGHDPDRGVCHQGNLDASGCHSGWTFTGA